MGIYPLVATERRGAAPVSVLSAGFTNRVQGSVESVSNSIGSTMAGPTAKSLGSVMLYAPNLPRNDGVMRRATSTAAPDQTKQGRDTYWTSTVGDCFIKHFSFSIFTGSFAPDLYTSFF